MQAEQDGGSEAVAAVCAQIEGALTEEISRLDDITAEEVARLKGCEQQSGSVLELYHSAASIKEAFENVMQTPLYL